MNDCGFDTGDVESIVESDMQSDVTEENDVSRSDVLVQERTDTLWEIGDDAAKTAADYVRSFEGYEKAADYVERHFDADAYTPGDVIPVTTRNQDLADLEPDNGVSFSRREVCLDDGLTLVGVFPEFDSVHHVELGHDANDMSLHRQFSACKSEFLDHMYDDPEKLEGISIGDMERLEKPQGYAPEGLTWNHNPDVGSYDLVPSAAHSIAHTGGNALWGEFENNK